LKKYDLPTQKPQPDLVSQSLKYMGMGVFAKAMDKAGVEAPTAGEPSTSGEASAAQKQRKKSVVLEQEEEDDRHIRFTIGGVGRRMTKEDFIRQMQTLDKPTRREVVEKSDASQGLKALAKLDAVPPPPQQQQPPQITIDSPAPSSTISRQDHAPDAAAARPVSQPAEQEAVSHTPSRSSSPGEKAGSSSAGSPSSSSGNEAPETDVERRRRVAALKGVGPAAAAAAAGHNSGSHDDNDDEDEEHGETAAERRRREAALGMAPHGEDGEDDSDDDDTPRVPPPRKSIRFADAAPDKGRGRSRE
jgi:hypothetical protein